MSSTDQKKDNVTQILECYGPPLKGCSSKYIIKLNGSKPDLFLHPHFIIRNNHKLNLCHYRELFFYHYISLSTRNDTFFNKEKRDLAKTRTSTKIYDIRDVFRKLNL